VRIGITHEVDRPLRFLRWAALTSAARQSDNES
jgi:3-methyladenine DNA glycosylase Mpg